MFGVYVHFPYCRVHCPYCDFAVAVRSRIPHAEYADAVIAELRERAPGFAGRDLVSIYFGGGTPSLWDPACVARVVSAICQLFGARADDLEITVEANPDLLPRKLLDDLRAAGVNRLSLGVQSLAPMQLVTLGRLHSAKEPIAAIADARAAGFLRVSLDLMYGLPSQSLEDLARDLDGVLALGPDHLSVYSLTIEGRTPFAVRAREGRLPLPDEDTHAAMAELVEERIERAGLDRYEVSSWAKEGFRAVHNSLYWSGGEWLGLGSSAHSFVRLPEGGGERSANVRGVDQYLKIALEKKYEQWISTREALSAEDLAREAMWLGLRRIAEGVVRGDYRARYGVDPVERFAAEIARLTGEGLLAVDAERVLLTRRGARFADEVGARFV